MKEYRTLSFCSTSIKRHIHSASFLCLREFTLWKERVQLSWQCGSNITHLLSYHHHKNEVLYQANCIYLVAMKVS